MIKYVTLAVLMAPSIALSWPSSQSGDNGSRTNTWTLEEPSPEEKSNHGNNRRQKNSLVLEGCSLSGSAAIAGFEILDHRVHKDWLAGMHKVNKFFSQMFGLSPEIHVVQDGDSPNAFAIKSSKDKVGSIAIGFNLMNEEINRNPGGFSLYAIQAHEHAHIAQFNRGYTKYPTPVKELQADYLAGVAMAEWSNRFLSHTTEHHASMLDAVEKMYSIGDYQFNDESHHGTPAQRRDAIRQGFNYGVINSKRFIPIDEVMRVSLSSAQTIFRN